MPLPTSTTVPNQPATTPWRASGLFSDHFLAVRLPTADASLWPAEAEARAAFVVVSRLWRDWSARLPQLNEEDCEERFIRPTLEALGYGVLPRRPIPGTPARQYPDFLLFDAPERATDVLQAGGDLYDRSIGLLEAKRWGLDLDKPSGRDKSPHQQTRDYLSDAPDGLHWAMLASGREWRLYHRHDRLSTYFAYDLGAVFTGHAAAAGATTGLSANGGAAAEEAAFERFRLFHALFRRDALLPDGAGLRPLDRVRAGSMAFREEVERDLRVQVFACVEILGDGLLSRVQNGLSAADLPAIYEHALVLLYRLLFVLNAEARGLLPTEPRDPASAEFYHAFGLAQVSQQLASPEGARTYASNYTAGLMERLRGLFALINGVQVSHGGADKNAELGVPRYNGGLFDPERFPALERWSLSDHHLAEVIRRLAFRSEADGTLIAIDYLNLGERHLGSIYEGLLEHRLVLAEAVASGDGGALSVRLANDKGERKTTGAYYTPQDLVAHIVSGTLRPILDGIDRALPALGLDDEPDDRFAEHVLALNVCDPAMGSGHFLVEALVVLAEAVALHPTTTPRRALAAEGELAGEPNDAATLAYWRRRVAEACIYGVDVNPLAVELAKLSLWLQTVDRVPLSFLDHHLRAGNSLIGARMAELAELPKPGKAPRGAGSNAVPAAGAAAPGTTVRQKRQTYRVAAQLPLTFSADLAHAVASAIAGIVTIEGEATESLAGAKRKEALWRRIAGETLAPFRAVADLWLGRWFGIDVSEELYRTALDEHPRAPGIRDAEAPTLAGERFFHWELEFPDVFLGDDGRRRVNAGFDAVVGNPPWERIKLQENEFFAARSPAIATAPRAADRKRLIARLPNDDPALWQDYLAAKARAEQTLAFVQRSGHFPLMGVGDTNLYAVFAERALDLVAPTGRVGLLVPSGIATDHTTRRFFQKLVDERRLAELLDFENRKRIFEDVDSRFKFSIVLMTGAQEPQDHVRSGFFLHRIADLDDPERTFALRPDDFRLFNPNTRTCPIFRRRRDYELTRAIYERVPVLVDRERGDEGNPWGVSFLRMFDMTNDSHLFRTATELEGDGFWLGVGNVYTRGGERCVPLYEGKMVQMYDHRAARIVVNAANVHRPAQPVGTEDAQYLDAAFSATPQYWVAEPTARDNVQGATAEWLLAYKDVTAPTNVRSVIAAAIPSVGVGNTLCLVLSSVQANTALLLANLNAVALDYVARQKIGGQHLNFFIVEQFPILPPPTYDADFHGVRLADFVAQRVLELSYTAHDLAGFAAAMGHHGPPFAWDAERRFHLRCQLDAVYLHLYGLDRAEAAEVLDTFPIVRRQDEARWEGRYRTKEVVLAYWNAYAAGDMGAWVKG